MPSDPKLRVTGYPDEAALAVLGYDREEDGQTAVIQGPARRLARLVEEAAREIDLSRAEWNAVADVMNGCADLYDYADSDVPALLMVSANLQDSPGVGRKWKVDVPALRRKLAGLTPLHGEAILCAARWFWRHPDTDHAEAEWWRPEYRRFRAGKE